MRVIGVLAAALLLAAANAGFGHSGGLPGADSGGYRDGDLDAGEAGGQDAAGDGGEAADGSCDTDAGPLVVRVQVDSRPYLGDLWPSTWAADDALYFGWGDGTGQAECIPAVIPPMSTPPDDWQWESCGDGKFWLYETCEGGCPSDQSFLCREFGCGPGHCYPLCKLARTGIRRDSGPVHDLEVCSSSESGDPVVREDSCIVALDPPDGDFFIDRKPSSLLFLGGDRLFAHIHTPCCSGTRLGFIMYNDGNEWTVVGDSAYPDGSPWGEASHFRVGMFIQMGRNHEQSPDGYVYMLGIDYEVEPLSQNQPVYLARVPANAMAGPGYESWEYLAHDGDDYYFSSDQSLAVPVAGDLGSTANPGGGTWAQGSAMYHPGLAKYVFLTGIVDFEAGDDHDTIDGAVYLTDSPWGPWTRVHKWHDADNRGFVPGLIAKDTGPNCVYFSYAGLPDATVLTYNLHIDKLVFRTPCASELDCGCGSRCVSGVCEVGPPAPRRPAGRLRP